MAASDAGQGIRANNLYALAKGIYAAKLLPHRNVDSIYHRCALLRRKDVKDRKQKKRKARTRVEADEED